MSNSSKNCDSLTYDEFLFTNYNFDKLPTAHFGICKTSLVPA